MSSHGQLNVFTGVNGTSIAMNSHGQLNILTWCHYTSTGMSSHGKIMFLQGIMTLEVQRAALDN
jgi:hypothetical protein